MRASVGRLFHRQESSADIVRMCLYGARSAQVKSWLRVLGKTCERCVFFSVRACVHVCVCLQPCLQGEVEAKALAAGLARLSGPNLQTDRGKGSRKQIGVIVCLPPCDMLCQH